MALTAPLLSEQQALNISQPDPSPESIKTNSGQSLLSPSFAEGQFYKPAAFYYKNRARLYFTLTEEFSAHFGLIKGLIEFYRSRHLKFTFNPDKKLFETDLEATRFADLAKLLDIVYDQVLREIRFKAALKKAILFEQRYKLESAEVYKF
jgi:hypothetical protein